MVVLSLIALDIILPLCILTILFFAFRKMKYLWVVPLVVIIINFFYILNDILSLQKGKSINDGIRYYFINDSSMGLYLIHIPMVLFSIIFTLCFIIAGKYLSKNREY